MANTSRRRPRVDDNELAMNINSNVQYAVITVTYATVTVLVAVYLSVSLFVNSINKKVIYR